MHAGRVAPLAGSGRWHETISAPRNRDDQCRAGVAERAAQLADALHEGVIGHDEVRPDRREQLVLGDQPLRILSEEPQDREGLGTQ
jgi:hypothetical protein